MPGAAEEFSRPGSFLKRSGVGFGVAGQKVICPSLRLHVIAEEHILIPHVEFAVRNDWMRPGRQSGTVRLPRAL